MTHTEAPRATPLPLFLFQIMSFTCSACNGTFASTKGLNQHRRICTFVQDEEALPEDAVAKYEAKKARKRQKVMHEATLDINEPMQNVDHNPTDSDVSNCYFP